MKSLALPVLVTLVLVSQTACLKTRSQIKEDGDETQASKPIPGQVQEVQPQGGYALDEVRSEITKLSGRVEDIEREKAQTGKQTTASQNEDIKRLENRIIELEQAQANMLEAITKMQSSAAPTEGKDWFDQGKAQFQANEFDAAVDSLSQYLKNPKGKHYEEATYLRGESLFQLKQYKKAIVDFSKFPEKFHKSSKMPQALYKIGLSFEALGMRDDARPFYQELAEKFPKSIEAKKIKTRLK